MMAKTKIVQPSRTEAQEAGSRASVAATRRRMALPSHALAVVAWNAADPATRGPRPRHPLVSDVSARALTRKMSESIGLGARIRRATMARKRKPATPPPAVVAVAREPVVFHDDEQPDPRFPRRR